jgi:hypothetical protein
MSSERSAGMSLLDMTQGYLMTQLLHIAAKLGIADVLADGPKSSAELAQAVGAHPRNLFRVLRALPSLGVFAENEAGHFALTPLAEPLRTGVPGSLRGVAILRGEESWWRASGQLLHTVKTGEVAFTHVHDMEFNAYLAAHAEAGDTYNGAMTFAGGQATAAVLAAYRFAGRGTIVDVGGGYGRFLAAMLQAYPRMHGILFDLPSVVEGARGFLVTEGVDARCEVMAGDFLHAVPHGGDLYLLQRVLNTLDDAHAAMILTNCRRAMADHGRLVIVSSIIQPGNDPSVDKLVDVSLMTLLNGLVRTEAEYRALFSVAGFHLTRVIPTSVHELHIIEGVPV